MPLGVMYDPCHGEMGKALLAVSPVAVAAGVGLEAAGSLSQSTLEVTIAAACLVAAAGFVLWVLGKGAPEAGPLDISGSGDGPRAGRDNQIEIHNSFNKSLDSSSSLGPALQVPERGRVRVTGAGMQVFFPKVTVGNPDSMMDLNATLMLEYELGIAGFGHRATVASFCDREGEYFTIPPGARSEGPAIFELADEHTGHGGQCRICLQHWPNGTTLGEPNSQTIDPAPDRSRTSR